MYKKSKRFLAGFLAFLLVVTMVPADMLSVVYAEEDDAIESQVLEDAESDNDDDAEEVIENDTDLKDGEIDLSQGSIELADASDLVYTGAEIKPEATVKDKDGNAVDSSKLKVEYTNNTNAGTATVTATPVDGETTVIGSVSETFTIGKLAITDATVTATGKAGEVPSVQVKVGNITVPTGDYELSYANKDGGASIDDITTATAGMAVTVTVTVKGSSTNFTGTATGEYEVASAASNKTMLTAAMIKLEGKAPAEYTAEATGSAITPAVTIEGCEEGDEKDFTVTYADNTAAGTAKVTVTPVSGSEKLTGSAVTVNFTITAKQEVETKDWELDISKISSTNLTQGIFMLSGTVNVSANNKSYVFADGKKTLTHKLNMVKKSGTTIKFTPRESGTLIVCALSGNNSDDREIQLKGGTLDVKFRTLNGGTSPEGSNVRGFEQRVEKNVEYTMANIATGGDLGIWYVAVEYDEAPVDLSKATVSVKVTDKDGIVVSSPKYTGTAYKYETTVTDENGKEVKSKRYTATLQKKNSEGSWTTAESLTGAGTYRVEVDTVTANDLTNGPTTSNEFVIAPADLTVENKTINIAPDTTESTGEFDIAKLFEGTAGADTLSYAYAVTTAGNVITSPAISDGKLTYTITKPAEGTQAESTVLTVTVTSDNYNTKTFTITVNMQPKVAIAVALESQTSVYNGGTYDFGDAVEIKTVTGESVTKEQAEQDLKDNLSYKYQIEGSTDAPTAAKPKNAGVYKITIELAGASAYTLSSAETSATLTINPRPIKLKAKNVTWDKAFEGTPVSGLAKATDYTFEAVDGEENPGLITGDTMATQPTIKYYKKDTTDELTADDWKALANDATVDIALSAADAGDNYTITYEKGTLTTLVRTAVAPTTAVPEATGATLLPANMTAGVKNTNVFSTDGCFIFTADAQNTVTVDSKDGSNTRFKMDGVGSPFYRSIGFTISKAAKLEVECISANGVSTRPVVLGKVNADGIVTSTKLGMVDGADGDTLTATIEEAGTYYIYSVAGASAGTDGAINITKVKVSYDGVVVSEKVTVNATVKDDGNLLNGAKVYFTATGVADVEAGTGIKLVKDKEYTLEVKNGTTPVTNVKATISGSGATTYTADTDNATVEIVVASTGSQDETVTVNATTTGLPAGAKVYFVKDSTKIEATSATVLTKGTTYDLKVLGTDGNEVSGYTAKINGSLSYEATAAESVSIVITEETTTPTGVTVTFMDGDTELTDLKLTQEGTTISLNLSTIIPTTAPTGKKFKGWSETKGGDPVAETEITITENKTYYAVWEDIAADKQATLTFMNGTTEIYKHIVEKGAKFNLTDIDKKITNLAADKVVAGWAEKADAKDAKYKTDDEITVSGDMTLYAVIKDAEFTICFMDQYGDNELSVSVKPNPAKKGEKIKMPNNVTNVPAATFDGWTLGDEKVYKAGEEYTVDTKDAEEGRIVFYEKWTQRAKYDLGMDAYSWDNPTYAGGAAVLPRNLEVYYKGIYLAQGSDYTIKASKNKNAGSDATFTVIGIGNYKGMKSDPMKFTINQRHLDYVDMPYEMTIVQGTKVNPIITYRGKQLKLGKDFELKEGSNIDAKGKYTGTATKPATMSADGKEVVEKAETREMTVKGIGNYCGECIIDIKVVEKGKEKQLAVDMNKFKPVCGDGTDYGYLFSDELGEADKDGNRTVKTPRKIKVTDKKAKTTALEEDKDFIVVWNGAEPWGNAGTYKFTVVGIGEYTGNVTKSFKVAPNKTCEVKAGALDYSETVKDQWSWSNKTNEPKFKTSLTGEYSSSKQGAVPDDEIYVFRKTTRKVPEQGADGKETEKEVTEWVILEEDDDYTITYSGNKKAGAAAKAKINFIGDYKGTKAVEVPFTVTGAPMGENTEVIVPDVAYTKAGQKCASKPIVIYDYDSEYGTGTILKANEYTVKYEWASASDIKTENGKETGWKDGGKDVKVTFTGSDKYARVKVTITPSAKSNFKLATEPQTGADGKETEVEVPLTAEYRVIKSDESGAIDLSKAKIEFFSDAKCSTKLKAVQFDEAEIFTPDVDEKGNYVELAKDETRIPVYVKVSVGKNEVPKNLYDVEWILGYYNAGKPTVLITGKGPSAATPASPAIETYAAGESSATDPSGDKPAPTTSFAAGSKTATIKIDPIKKWIAGSYKKTDNPTQTVTNFLKELF